MVMIREFTSYQLIKFLFLVDTNSRFIFLHLELVETNKMNLIVTQ